MTQPKAIKDEVIDMVSKMPQDTTVDDIMEALYVRTKIDKGLKQLDEGNYITHEEAKKRLSKWLTK
jgi:predicted transcriptional regulator